MKKDIKMDVEKLKSVYDAARALNNHNQDQAADGVGKSKSTIYKVFNREMTSQPAVDAILDYCYKAGLKDTIRKNGLDPDAKVKDLKEPATN